MEYLFLAISGVISALVNALHPRRGGVVRHVVAFKLDHLGDLITAAPAISAIKRRHPDAELTLVVGSWCAELARSLSSVDVVVVYDSPQFDRTRAGGKEPAQRGLRGALNRRRYDVAYGFREDPAVLGFCLFGGCRRRRDRGTVRIGDRVRRIGAVLRGRGDPGPESEFETNLRVVGVAGGDAPALPPLTVSPDDVERVREDVMGESLNASRPLIVIHPGAAWTYRLWPVDRYSDLATRLYSKHRGTIVVTGSAEERALADRVLAGGVQGRSVAGDYDIGRVAALLSLADVYIGSDTGITLLAAAVGTPVVALFGPGDPRRFGHVGPYSIVLYHKQDCSPCPQLDCDQDGACMKAITVDEVAEAVAVVLRAVDNRTRSKGISK